VVVGAAGAAEHLFELLDGEPLDTHRERVEDDLRGGEVDARRERRGRDDGGEILFAEPPFDALSLAVIEPGVVGGRAVLEPPGDLVAPPP